MMKRQKNIKTAVRLGAAVVLILTTVLLVKNYKIIRQIG